MSMKRAALNASTTAARISPESSGAPEPVIVEDISGMYSRAERPVKPKRRNERLSESKRCTAAPDQTPQVARPVERSRHGPKACRPGWRGLAISRTGRGGLAYYALW